MARQLESTNQHGEDDPVVVPYYGRLHECGCLLHQSILLEWSVTNTTGGIRFTNSDNLVNFLGPTPEPIVTPPATGLEG